ncbi:MAG: hypothetical protein ACI9PZ_002835 [Parvicella sp.]|jgi:uncharacterized protein YdiU (UPF0061 family)
MALKNLQFDNRFLAELPVDPIIGNQRRQVNGACSSRVKPTTVSAPQMVAYSHEVAALLNLDKGDCESEIFTQTFAGNNLLDAMDPYACCYGGHQFGNWAGQLGDGRAINLGEIVNTESERWALQLKGAGLTPYSRTADGLAVLRSSVREFLCSEAMHHLGVPTTRALSLLLTGEKVLRDILYDGHPQYEPGAIVCRVAPSFTRFGSFQIHSSRSDIDVLKQLLDYTITTDFPHLGQPSKEAYIAFLKEVVEKTALMIVEWMRVGFVHGVMNTDNMSILGLTIDYGPYGWLEPYDPEWTPNTTDSQNRRYRFDQQAQIAHWNLVQLAQALLPVIEEVEPLQEIVNGYPAFYQNAWQNMMAGKLGLAQFQGEDDLSLINDLLETLQIIETDMTLFFRDLSNYSFTDTEAVNATDAALVDVVHSAYYEERSAHTDKAMATWLRRYSQRLGADNIDPTIRAQAMNQVNPLYVMRNYLAQEVIDEAEKDNFALLNELLDTLRNPYTEQAGKERFAAKRPDWARNRAGCSMLSCSS